MKYRTLFKSNILISFYTSYRNYLFTYNNKLYCILYVNTVITVPSIPAFYASNRYL